MTHSELEALFLEQLPLIDRILAAQARRHALDSDDAADLAHWVKARLIESDYALLAKFRGESSLGTFLTLSLARLASEYRAREHGRWRPSAAAKRHGPVGLRLEALTQRSGLRLSVAAEMMRSAGETSLSDAELGRIAAELPSRTWRRPVRDPTAIETVPEPVPADALVEKSEALARETFMQQALAAALALLPSEDALIIRLHFMEGLSIADVARSLALPQKPLYRRLDRSLAMLRRELERRGVTREEYLAVFTER
jgi:RNA polymerase sigma factor for flagellar operon FliA